MALLAIELLNIAATTHGKQVSMHLRVILTSFITYLSNFSLAAWNKISENVFLMHHWGLGIGNVTFRAGKCFYCMLYCQLHWLVPTKIHYLVRSVYLFTYCSPMPKDTTRSGTSSQALRHLEQHHASPADCERSRSWRHGSADSTREQVQTTQEPQVGQKNCLNSRSNIVRS